MQTITGDYQARDGKNYYSLVITVDKKTISFKNFSCSANVSTYCEQNQIPVAKLLFMNTEQVDMARVPKKYAKIVLENLEN